MTKKATNTNSCPLIASPAAPQRAAYGGIFKYWGIRANNLRMCVGCACLGLTVAAYATQADMPKNEVPNKTSPQTHNPSAKQIRMSAPSFSGSGEMLLSNKNPKAAAMSLKEAILSMNASTGSYYKNQ